MRSICSICVASAVLWSRAEQRRERGGPAGAPEPRRDGMRGVVVPTRTAIGDEAQRAAEPEPELAGVGGDVAFPGYAAAYGQLYGASAPAPLPLRVSA